MPDYADLVKTVVKRLVLDPDKVEVSEIRDESGSILINIKAAQEDIGRIIGKRGATVNAIRLLTKAAATKSGDRVDVDIDEE